MIDLGSWRATLAPIGEPTVDGRVLASDNAVRPHAEQPRPLWHDRPGAGRRLIGTVDSSEVVDGVLIAAGSFRVDDADEWYTMGLIEGMRAGRIVPVVELVDVEIDPARAGCCPPRVTSGVIGGVLAVPADTAGWAISRFEVEA